MLKKYKIKFFDFRLVIALIAISSIGVHLVGLAMPELEFKQLVGVIFGVVLMTILAFIDYSWILNFQWIMYIFNIVMLLGVRIFGSSANGASRWIDLGFVRFQPTELSKIILILFFAKFLMDHEEDLNTLKTIGQAVIYLAIPFALIYVQPDLKNTITVTIIFFILFYIAGLSYKIIIGAFLIFIPLIVIFLALIMSPNQKIIHDYQRNRIMSFLYPDNEEYSDDIEQQRNSKTAIASGEAFGKNINSQNSIYSVNKGNFVAFNHTDFILAVAGEEYGFVGCVIIVGFLSFISIECVRISKRAKDMSGKIICCGIGSIVALQSFINICVATGIAPNTGTPLPFISYGLSSIVSFYIGMGIVLNVGLQSSAYHSQIKPKKIIKMEDYL